VPCRAASFQPNQPGQKTKGSERASAPGSTVRR
jgi:hypothetical protein